MEKNRQNENSKEYIKMQLIGWEREKSPAVQFFNKMEFSKFNKSILLAFAKIFSELLNVHDLYRDHYRSMDMLYKWFDDHWDLCKPLLEKTCFVDKNFQLLTKSSPNILSLLESYTKQLDSNTEKKELSIEDLFDEDLLFDEDTFLD